MKIVKCSCKWCRSGLRTKSTSLYVHKTIKGARRRAKMDLKAGREPAEKVYLIYTD